MYDEFENLYEIAYNATYSLKDFGKAISMYKSAPEKGKPTAGFYYHYAVALTKIGKRDEAFSKLHLALSVGLQNAQQFLDYSSNDENLKNLHDDARWKEFIDIMENRARTQAPGKC